MSACRDPVRERQTSAVRRGTRTTTTRWRAECFLDPDGTRAHATPAASYSNCASGRVDHGEAARRKQRRL
jgi:hypothetical protein